jgi:sugar phosphate isomerase/epimerase
MPEPEDLLDWIADIGFEGTELGPPGYLGDAALRPSRR